MALTVKAYLRELLGDGTKEEIRRFSVDQDVTTNFAYLQQKLVQVFPSLNHNTTFFTHWKDPEGEYVAFSTDEELLEALGHVKDGVLRVYVTGGTKDEGPVHRGVTCDGCNDQIRGIRYKCMSCHDYDLCRSCEGKGVHPDHEMLRITTPRRFGALPAWMAFVNPGMHGPPSHCQKKWMKRCWKAAMAQAYGNPTRGDGKDQESDPATKEDANNEKPMDQDVGETMADLLDPLGINSSTENETTSTKKVDNDVKGSSKCSGKGKGKCSTRKERRRQEEETCDENQHWGQCGPAGPPRCGPMGPMGWGKCGPGIIAGCGTMGPGPKGWGKCGPMGPPGFGPMGPGGFPGCGPCGPGMRKRMRPWGPPFGMLAGKAPWMKPWFMANMADEEAKSCKGKKDEKKAENATQDLHKETAENTENNATENNASQNEKERSTSPQEWTILDVEINSDDKTPPSAPMNTDNDTEHNIAQYIVSTEPITPTSEPTAPNVDMGSEDFRIAHAVSLMKAMGFNDEGGWLTSLVQAKDGDINKVLDILRPANVPQ